MGTVFWRTLKDRWVLLLIYTLATIAFLWMYIALFPSFGRNLKLDAFKSMPEGFMKAFNFDINSFATLEGFLSTEEFSLMWPLFVILLTVGYASFALAGEIEKGTIDVLLSQPLSRLKLFTQRYLAGWAMLVVFTFLSIVAMIPLARIYNISINAQHVYWMILLAFLFGWSIYSLGMLCSALFSDRGKVYFGTVLVIVAMYVLNILASLKDSLNHLKYGSFFYYFAPSKALIYGTIDHWAYLVFGGAILVCTLLAAWRFSRRDISV